MTKVMGVALVSLLLFGACDRGDPEPDVADSPSATATPTPPPATSTDATAPIPSPTVLGTLEDTCDEVETFDDEGRDHVPDGEVVEYNSDPPTSGPHYAVPAEPGFYSEPLPDEQVVHNLEHGQIVVWYSAGAPLDVIDQLASVVAGAEGALLAAPRALPDANAIVLTAWTVMQRCTGVNVGEITEFRAQFQGRGPERVTPPFTP